MTTTAGPHSRGPVPCLHLATYVCSWMQSVGPSAFFLAESHDLYGLKVAQDL